MNDKLRRGNGRRVVKDLSRYAIRLMWSIHMHNLHLVLAPVQEIHHLIIAIVVVVDGTHGLPCIRPIATHSAPCTRTTLWTRAGWVCTSVLAVSDTQVSVVWLVLDTINRLDGIRDVHEVDKCAISDNRIKVRT